MALTDRYVRDDAAGGGDGTTNNASGATGAWTFAEMIAATATLNAGGFRVNIRPGTYSRTTSADTLPAGVATAPNIYRGFNSNPDDLLSNGRSSGVLVTTNFPLIDYSTGRLTQGNYTILECCRVEGNPAATLLTGGTATQVRRCKILNDATTGGSAAGFTTGTGGAWIDDCDVETQSNGSPNAVILDRGVATHCYIKSSTGPCLYVSTYGHAEYCTLNGGSYALSISSGATWASLDHCSIYGQSSGALNTAGGTLNVKNCIAYGGGGSTKFFNASAVKSVMFENNAVGGYGAADSSFGDWPDRNRISLSGNPFMDAVNGDFRLNANTGAGLSCRGTGTWPYVDIGALQHMDINPPKSRIF